jgi:methyl-accepting chemotaxis protein
MTEIVASVQRVSDIIGEISAASSEQSSGIGQVNGAVSSLDQTTQQNAALVEESTAAAESLREQAQRLAQVVGEFRLSASSPAAALPAPRPAKPGIGVVPPRRAQALATPPVLATPRPLASQGPAMAPTKVHTSSSFTAAATSSPNNLFSSAPAPTPGAPPDAAPHAPARVAQSTIERARDGARAAAGDDWESF